MAIITGRSMHHWRPPKQVEFGRFCRTLLFTVGCVEHGKTDNWCVASAKPLLNSLTLKHCQCPCATHHFLTALLHAPYARCTGCRCYNPRHDYRRRQPRIATSALWPDCISTRPKRGHRNGSVRKRLPVRYADRRRQEPLLPASGHCAGRTHARCFAADCIDERSGRSAISPGYPRGIHQ